MEYPNISFLNEFYKLLEKQGIFREVVQSMGVIKKSKKILMIGFCGKYLGFFENSFVAIPQNYEFVRWPNIRPFKTIIVDDEHLPFSPETWDVVISINQLEYAQNIDKVTAELSRILKVQGKLISVLLNDHEMINHVENIIKNVESKSFKIINMKGFSKNIQIWPYSFDMTFTNDNQYFLKFFPFLSDLILFKAQKIEMSAVCCSENIETALMSVAELPS